jgi:YihY family inner membrane protein
MEIPISSRTTNPPTSGITLRFKIADWETPLFGNYFKTAPFFLRTLGSAVKKYYKIEGTQSGAAFAYYAFFSLFPLLGLMVATASYFVDQDRAIHEVIGYVRDYLPLNASLTQNISDTLNGMVDARGKVIVIAPVILLAGVFHFFNVLIKAINRAWGTEAKSWWHLTAKNFLLLGIMGTTLLVGLGVPLIGRVIKHWVFSNYDFGPWLYYAAIYAVPLLFLFLGLNLLYKLSPLRPTRFSEVWKAALAVTALLFALECLFVFCVKKLGHFNVVYGTFGGMVALLTLIDISGCITIMGSCLSAAQAGAKSYRR